MKNLGNIALAATGATTLMIGTVGTAHSATINGFDTVGNVSDAGAGSTFLQTDGVADSELESFLGLSSGALDTFKGANVTNGSAIKQTISATAGDILSFDFAFDAGDYLPYDDFAFFSITDTLTQLSSVAEVGDFGSSGLQSFTYAFTGSGTYTVGVGVANLLDQGFDSSLTISNVSSQPVPEPASVLGIMAFGALGGGKLLKRKRQQKQAALSE